MPLGGQRPTCPLQHPHSAPRFCRGSLCHPVWPNLPGNQIRGTPAHTLKMVSVSSLPSSWTIGRALLPAVEHGEMAVGTRADRGTCGEADPLPGLPSRSVTGL